MSAARTLLLASLAGLAAAVVVGAVAPWAGDIGTMAQDLGEAHMALGLFAFIIPAFTALHLHSVAAITKRPAPPAKAKVVAALWVMGGIVLGAESLLPDDVVTFNFTGPLVVIAAAGMTTGLMLGVLPKRGQSVVDVTADPLTKGDDASFQHARFAHFLLPVGVAAVAISGPWFDWSGAWAARTWLVGLHLLLAGYGLFSCYGLSHLWVPRLSGVPAIAAGAIKGELHSSLLGLLFITAGFAFSVRGLIIAGGALLFLGAFTWMGVLGANIMRNKSKTQRVTAEFVYVPWTFTGVFWLISGVLLGIFLNVVPDIYDDRVAGLRFAHVHMALFGGFAQVLLGLATRLLPAAAGQPPVSFQRAKWGFYLLNIGLGAMLYGHLAAGVNHNAFRVGALLASLGLAAAFMTLTRHRRQAGGS